jgi:hypothetical protein
MNDEQRIRRLEEICRAQQDVIDCILQHLQTMAAQARSQGVQLQGMTYGRDLGPLTAARSL